MVIMRPTAKQRRRRRQRERMLNELLDSGMGIIVLMATISAIIWGMAA